VLRFPETGAPITTKDKGAKMPDSNVDQGAREQIAEVRQDMVRKDVYAAEQKGMLARVAEVEKDNMALEAKIEKIEDRRAADRRLILTSLILPIIVALVLLYVTSQIGQ
jgi:hypothetical protein